ncbi:hypothetical protein C8J57DRAFT_138168 [Mycena rebaudengoi]|nr:hypothetical protein C8J57DRAFT_138168 [Mycena rebaudengoi]
MTWRHLFGSVRVFELFKGLLGSTAPAPPPPIFAPQLDIDPPVDPETASPPPCENDLAIAILLLYVFCATINLNVAAKNIAPPETSPLQPSPTLLECSAARPPRVRSVTDPTALNPAATTPLSPIAARLPRSRTRTAPGHLPAAIPNDAITSLPPSLAPALAPLPSSPSRSINPLRPRANDSPPLAQTPPAKTPATSSILYETQSPTPVIYQTSAPRNMVPAHPTHHPVATNDAGRLTRRVPSRIVYHARPAPPPLYPPVPQQGYLSTLLYHGSAFYPSHVAHFGAAPVRPLLVQ